MVLIVCCQSKLGQVTSALVRASPNGKKGDSELFKVQSDNHN
uniref:Uncharacterized protein n=1 Tax=Anguilla anguilla TaxID=7936 RepID=A0A0E9V588_ANGAN